jgi:peptidoglycan/xylan/chitin deacetylase (PgdA/CDA1 family)
MLTWEQLAELDRNGIEIGSHSHLHRPIDTVPRRVVRSEVLRSRELLADHLGHAPASFAYPHGYSSRRVRELVASAFDQACAVKDALSGPGDDPTAIARLFVGWGDTGDRVERLLTEGHRRRTRHERLVTRGWRIARRLRSCVAPHASHA